MTVIAPESLSSERVIEESTLVRSLTWKDAFWVCSGVPALVLFGIGAIASTVGNISWIIWTISVIIGFVQLFTYAEVAGLFPHKSGGASVYAAVSWVRYGKILAPISVWCNWLAWTPVLALGSSIAAGYILSILFAPEAVVNSWSLTLLDLGFIKSGLTIRINATFILGLTLMLTVFAIQHRGILASAKVQMLFGICALLPLILIGIVPIITGDMPLDHFTPFVPLAHDANGAVVPGHWDMAGLTLIAGGMLVAGWSSYGFETAVCYTREFKDPGRDTFKTIFYCGLLGLFVYSLVPLAFQGALGLGGMLDPGIADGSGVARAMARMIGASGMWLNLIVVLLVLALVLSIQTGMAGSSRTLYQGSVDGWLPRYLSHVNHNGAPTRAMWTDLIFNAFLLSMSDNVFVLAVSSAAYYIFVFMNLQSGWIHRIDRPNWARPYRCPNWLLGAGAMLGYLNLFFLGMGANTWGPGTLISGMLAAAMIVPVFCFRHYVQDKGEFPAQMKEDMYLSSEDGVTTRAGILPYLALGVGVVVIAVSRYFGVY